MESTVLAAIMGALAAGALDGSKDLAKKAISDGYEKLRSILANRFGSNSDLEPALKNLERRPTSQGRQDVLKEELELAGAAADKTLLEQASRLLELVQGLQSQSSGGQVAHGSGIAQADRGGTASVTIKEES